MPSSDSGTPQYGRARVNGVTLHYAIAGAGEPVYLVHGAPKTHRIWRHVMPLLADRYTVVAPDCRGYGESERPPTGYDTRTMADDIVALAEHLGHPRIRIVGEDWGAAIAYAAAAFHRDRVQQLVYQEMRLPGLAPVPSHDALAPDDTRTGWHFHFFAQPHYPELLLTGRERPFWSTFVRRTMVKPHAATVDDLDDIIRWVERPGGLHTILSVYRSAELDAEQNRTQFGRPLTIPVLALGGAGYLGDEPAKHMRQVARNVTAIVLDHCGHNPSWEAPGDLAQALIEFFAAPPRTPT